VAHDVGEHHRAGPPLGAYPLAQGVDGDLALALAASEEPAAHEAVGRERRRRRGRCACGHFDVCGGAWGPRVFVFIKKKHVSKRHVTLRGTPLKANSTQKPAKSTRPLTNMSKEYLFFILTQTSMSVLVVMSSQFFAYADASKGIFFSIMLESFLSFAFVGLLFGLLCVLADKLGAFMMFFMKVMADRHTEEMGAALMSRLIDRLKSLSSTTVLMSPSDLDSKILNANDQAAKESAAVASSEEANGSKDSSSDDANGSITSEKPNEERQQDSSETTPYILPFVEEGKKGDDASSDTMSGASTI
jgi:hypothetical protein